jgi:LmbE family N-acetylglucosaminyl deacetylase
MTCVLHLSPHPDDELIGSPATLLALQSFGFKIINVACSLGRKEDRTRRKAELEEACRRVGFDLIIPPNLPGISAGDDLVKAENALANIVQNLIAEIKPAILFSPSPHDGHHGHEVIGRVARRAIEGSLVRWWMWGLWADLPVPNIVTPFNEDKLSQILYGLEAHAGEIERNDYRKLVSARASANAILAAERVFGFGSQSIDTPYAEVVMEAVPFEGDLLLGSARILQANNVLISPRSSSLTPWITQTSVRDALGLRKLKA